MTKSGFSNEVAKELDRRFSASTKTLAPDDKIQNNGCNINSAQCDTISAFNRPLHSHI